MSTLWEAARRQDPIVLAAAAAALDEVEGLLGVMLWPGLMDAWTDLLDSYVKLPGGLRRGPRGRRLLSTLTAQRRDPSQVLAVVRDALVVPFWLQLLADPSAWVERVPVARGGAIHHLHPRGDGVDVPTRDGGTTRCSRTISTPASSRPRWWRPCMASRRWRSDGGAARWRARLSAWHRTRSTPTTSCD